MNLDEVRTRIRERVVALCATSDLADDDDFFELGLLSSLYALRLVQSIEKEFGFTVPDGELRVANFRSIDAMVQLVGKSKELR
jgi:acyl carrier protein